MINNYFFLKHRWVRGGFSSLVVRSNVLPLLVQC